MTAPLYLPWVRAGLAAGIVEVDPLGGDLPARATFRATATVTTRTDAGTSTAGEQTQDVALLGPGDITGLQPGFVIRVQPSDGAVDVEPNYFATAELTVPYLPWMFTPAAPNTDRLRPFLVLVVVPDGPCTLEAGGSGRLPVLRIDDVAGQLPDLSQSYAWAHAQVSALGDVTAGDRPRSLARLMCPRLLLPRTRYIAAIVPAFEPGRRAGLGLPDASAATTQPAWDVTAAGTLDLPVYHAWRFATGDDGDFQALVTRLKRVALTADTTAGRVAFVDAQAGLPELAGWRFPGALGECPDPSPPAAFTAALTGLVDAVTTVPGMPLPPPLYGRRHAAVTDLANVPAGKAWLRRLNGDPRYRTAAAIGARLVRDQQESLMAAAWRQVGAVEAANALLRHAQTARQAGTALHDRLSTLDAAVLVQISGPLLARVLDPTTRATLAAAVAGSRAPVTLAGGAARKVLRPRGPLGRRSGQDAAGLLKAVDAGTPVVEPRPRPDGMVTIDDCALKDSPRWCTIDSRTVAAKADAPRPPGSAAQWQAMVRALAVDLQMNPGCGPIIDNRPALPLAHARDVLVDATVPARTIAARVSARIGRPAGWSPADPLTPILAAPRIDTPLARDLIALSPSLLLPGIADVPAESVTAVPANRRFIEALMVGANEALMRELVWRGYPTDQRGTPLRRFWDRRGSVAGPTDDLPAIDHTWTGELGDHLAGHDIVVVLLRGQVLRRYPDLAVYAHRARWDGDQRVPVEVPAGVPLTDPAHPQRMPAFSGVLPPDAGFCGFDLPDDPRGDPDPAANRPGWFFVLQQPATRLRFGLDVSSSGLSWASVTRTPSGHVDLAGPLTGATRAGWGLSATSADLAQWCEQKPFRVCLHASDLLPQES